MNVMCLRVWGRSPPSNLLIIKILGRSPLNLRSSYAYVIINVKTKDSGNIVKAIDYAHLLYLVLFAYSKVII